jgi:hypothetical protein
VATCPSGQARHIGADRGVQLWKRAQQAETAPAARRAAAPLSTIRALRADSDRPTGMGESKKSRDHVGWRRISGSRTAASPQPTMSSTIHRVEHILARYSRAKPGATNPKELHWERHQQPTIKLAIDTAKSRAGALESVRLRITWTMDGGTAPQIVTFVRVCTSRSAQQRD